MAFGAAVWLRLRSYDADAPPTVATATTPSTVSADAVQGVNQPSDPGVIVPVNEDGTPLTSGTSATSREQRYNELLREQPPVAPAPPPAPKEKSFFSRVADTLGISRPQAQPSATQPRPQPSPAPTSQPRPPKQQPQVSSESPRNNNPQEQQPNIDEQDADSDIVAPQLLSATFEPAVVQDGERTTFTVVAQDNLSGVRSVSGVISSPSGSVQGFACQATGEPNHFRASISVPREAPAGTWQVKYLTLSDNASNSVNLNSAQGALPPTANFRVVASASDTTAPGLKAIWLDRPGMRAGDRNTVFVQTEDDKTGVSLVSGVFVSPGRQARLAFGCRLGSAGAWECPLTPPRCLDCGVWKLEQVQMQDKANNMTTVRADNPIVGNIGVDISGESCDGNAPVLSGLSLNPVVVSNLEGGSIEVRATISDDLCGTASVSGQAIPQGGVGGQRAYFSMQPAGDGTTFVGMIAVQKHAAKGTWTIAWLQLLDKGHNLRVYSANEPIVSRVTFQVE